MGNTDNDIAETCCRSAKTACMQLEAAKKLVVFLNGQESSAPLESVRAERTGNLEHALDVVSSSGISRRRGFYHPEFTSVHLPGLEFRPYLSCKAE